MQRIPIVPGVRAVEHTADLALEVEASSLPELFDRAARGMLALIERAELHEAPEAPTAGCAPAPAATEEQVVELAADGATRLLVLWLRELLFLHQARHLAYRGAEFERFDEQRLRARLRLEPGAFTAVRELKGVTYHGLEVERRGAGWWARVIFDV